MAKKKSESPTVETGKKLAPNLDADAEAQAAERLADSGLIPSGHSYLTSDCGVDGCLRRYDATHPPGEHLDVKEMATGLYASIEEQMAIGAELESPIVLTPANMVPCPVCGTKVAVGWPCSVDGHVAEAK